MQNSSIHRRRQAPSKDKRSWDRSVSNCESNLLSNYLLMPSVPSPPRLTHTSPPLTHFKGGSETSRTRIYAWNDKMVCSGGRAPQPLRQTGEPTQTTKASELSSFAPATFKNHIQRCFFPRKTYFRPYHPRSPPSSPPPPPPPRP